MSQQPFDTFPDMQRVEHGVQRIGDGTVVDLLRVRVMHGMMLWCLQDAQVLQQRDAAAVFTPRAV